MPVIDINDQLLSSVVFSFSHFHWRVRARAKKSTNLHFKLLKINLDCSRQLFCIDKDRDIYFLNKMKNITVFISYAIFSLSLFPFSQYNLHTIKLWWPFFFFVNLFTHFSLWWASMCLNCDWVNMYIKAKENCCFHYAVAASFQSCCFFFF